MIERDGKSSELVDNTRATSVSTDDSITIVDVVVVVDEKQVFIGCFYIISHMTCVQDANQIYADCKSPAMSLWMECKWRSSTGLFVCWLAR
jgi:hypothetical protein